jgi:hypothetical protein
MNDRAGEVFERAASVYPPHVSITYCLTGLLRRPVKDVFWQAGAALDSLFEEILSGTRANVPKLTQERMKSAWAPLAAELNRLEPGPDGKRIGALLLRHWMTGNDAEAKHAELAGWRDTAHAEVIAALCKDERGLVFAYASGMLTGSAVSRRPRRSKSGRTSR